MRTTSGRIPKAVDTLNSYLINTTAYLLADSPVQPLPPTGAALAVPLPIKNWQRLTMIQTEMDAWANYKNQWSLLFSKYSDKKESRTSTITIKLHDVETAFRTFAQPILNMISGVRTVTADDASVLNVVIKRAEPTHPVTPIVEIPEFLATPIGGAEIRFTVRPGHDTKRASKLPGATGIELRYTLGDTKPSAAGECPHLFTSTKSIFILNLPDGSQGESIYIFARWVVANNPTRNGPWSGVSSVIVA